MKANKNEIVNLCWDYFSIVFDSEEQKTDFYNKASELVDSKSSESDWLDLLLKYGTDVSAESVRGFLMEVA